MELWYVWIASAALTPLSCAFVTELGPARTTASELVLQDHRHSPGFVGFSGTHYGSNGGGGPYTAPMQGPGAPAPAPAPSRRRDEPPRRGRYYDQEPSNGVMDGVGNYVAPMQGPGAPPPTPARRHRAESSREARFDRSTRYRDEDRDFYEDDFEYDYDNYQDDYEDDYERDYDRASYNPSRDRYPRDEMRGDRDRSRRDEMREGRGRTRDRKMGRPREYYSDQRRPDGQFPREPYPMMDPYLDPPGPAEPFGAGRDYANFDRYPVDFRRQEQQINSGGPTRMEPMSGPGPTMEPRPRRRERDDRMSMDPYNQGRDSRRGRRYRGERRIRDNTEMNPRTQRSIYHGLSPREQRRQQRRDDFSYGTGNTYFTPGSYGGI